MASRPSVQAVKEGLVICGTDATRRRLTTAGEASHLEISRRDLTRHLVSLLKEELRQCVNGS